LSLYYVCYEYYIGIIKEKKATGLKEGIQAQRTSLLVASEGLQSSFPSCGSLMGDGALQNIKFQATNLRVSGVGVQVSGN
jgi:hypothetical protein